MKMKIFYTIFFHVLKHAVGVLWELWVGTKKISLSLSLSLERTWAYLDLLDPLSKQGEVKTLC
jgi:hypothetical protein